MKKYEVWAGGELLYGNVSIADDFWSRFKGLMFRKGIGPDEGLLIRKCGSIHCFWMKFVIDVVYLNDEYEVLKVETVRPWQVGSVVKGARHVLEVNEGCQIRPGTKLVLKEACHEEDKG